MNYSQNYWHELEKEGLAIVFAIKKFYKYIHRREFILQTDHRPLLAIFGSKKGIPTNTANLLVRWAMMQVNYSFKMEFLPSKEIAHANGLSRLTPKNTKPLEETVITALRPENTFHSIQLKNFQLRLRRYNLRQNLISTLNKPKKN